MERKLSTSSRMKSLGHDPETNQMDIEFKNGKIYRYENVTTEMFNSVFLAESQGQALNQLTSNYPGITFKPIN